jgi:hypothetical protein
MTKNPPKNRPKQLSQPRISPDGNEKSAHSRGRTFHGLYGATNVVKTVQKIVQLDHRHTYVTAHRAMNQDRVIQLAADEPGISGDDWRMRNLERGRHENRIRFTINKPQEMEWKRKYREYSIQRLIE